MVAKEARTVASNAQLQCEKLTGSVCSKVYDAWGWLVTWLMNVCVQSPTKTVVAEKPGLKQVGVGRVKWGL
jgi:hypothetical protein